MLENGVPIDQVLAELAERHRMDDPYADRPGMVNMYNTGLDTVGRSRRTPWNVHPCESPLLVDVSECLCVGEGVGPRR